MFSTITSSELIILYNSWLARVKHVVHLTGSIRDSCFKMLLETSQLTVG